MTLHLDPYRGPTEVDDQLLAALPTGRETVPVSRARRHVAAMLPEGAPCPVCGQHAQLYRRRITTTMAAQLIDAYGTAGTDYFHAPSLGVNGGDFAKLALWELIAPKPTKRADGGAAGWWRITKAGVAFIEGKARVPQWALVYDGRRIGFDGDTVAITSVHEGFDLRDIAVDQGQVDAAADALAGDDRPPVDVAPPEAPGTPEPNPGRDQDTRTTESLVRAAEDHAAGGAIS